MYIVQKVFFSPEKLMVKYMIKNGYCTLKQLAVFVYFFVCKLILTCTAALASGGFSDWQIPIANESHENSEEHRAALLTYLTIKHGSTLDSKLAKQRKSEQQ